MNFVKKYWSKLFLTASFFLIPVTVLYAALATCKPGTICNPLDTTSTIPELIQKVLEGLLKLGIPVVALAIIYCGFLFVFARGNSEKITKARDALIYTLIGAAILLGAWAIAKMIASTVTAL